MIMNQLETDQTGQSQGISIRVGPGLYERVKDLCEEADVTMSRATRWMLEGAVELLEAAKTDNSLQLPHALGMLKKRREANEGRGARRRLTSETAKDSPRLDAMEQQLSQIMQLLKKREQ